MFITPFLTEEQELIRQSAREFTINEVKPRAMEIDRNREFPRDLLMRCGELGFLRTMVPENLGGLGLGATEAGLIIEEIAKESPGFSMAVQNAMQAPITLFAYPDLTDKFEAAVAGKIVCEFAVTDPAGNSNYDEWSIMAKKDGDDWILNGSKNFVTANGDAEVCFVPAKCDDGQYRLFATEKGRPGFDNSHIERLIGFAGVHLGSPTWVNCRLPQNRAIPYDPFVFGFGGALLTMTTTAFGAAEGVLEKTVEFTKNRTRSFKPLISLQVVAHKLAHNLTKIEVGRNMLFNAYRALDEGKLDANMACMTKAWVTEMAVEVTKDCVQLHGGLGVCEDTGIARYYRDVIPTTIGDWTSDLHYQTIAFNLGWQESRGL